MKPTIGRIVHFVVGRTHTPKKIAPAIIVQVLSDTCVNLRVFYDGTNHVLEGTTEWEMSVSFDDKEDPDYRTWHWPPKV